MPVDLTAAQQANAIREAIRRQAALNLRNNKIASYFPDGGPFRRELYKKHIEFFEAGSYYKERLFVAANRIGKSESGAFESVCHATGKYPNWWKGRRFAKETEGWACGTTGETTRDIVQAKLLGPVGQLGTGMIPAHLIVKTTSRRGGIADALESIQVKHVSGKISTIGLKSYQQGRESFEGTSKDWIWCIAKGELVQMANGTLRRIESVKVGDNILSLDCDGRPVARKVLRTVNQGKKPCVRIWPKHGTPIVCTPDHDIYWGYSRKSKSPAANVKAVAQPRPGWWPDGIQDREDSWYIWTALVVAEGYIAGKKVTNGSIELMEEAIRSLPPEARVRRQDFKNAHVPDWHLVWPKFWRQMAPAVSNSKSIPSWVFTSSKEKVSLFLRWLYMGDGWASGHTIGYATTSSVLAQQLVILLNRLGVRATSYLKKPQEPEWAPQYWVCVSRSSDVLAFALKIGIAGKHLAMQPVKDEAIRRLQSNSDRGEGLVEHGRREFTSRNDAARLKASKIRSIEEVGEREVYDLTVENEHRFLCGTSLVSNCDEEPPADVYTECLYRTVTTRGIVYTTFTPLNGMSDIVKGFLEPEDESSNEYKWHIQAGWNDVPHIHEDEKKALIATTPPYQIKARTEGEPALGSGAIYPIAESEITVPVMQIPGNWPRAFAMDVGWHRTAALWGARDPSTNKIIIYDEYYQSMGEPASHAMGVRARGDWIPGVIDPACQGSSQIDGRRLIDMYRNLGLKITPAENSVEAGILEVWNLLVSGQLKIMANCFNFFKEFRQYHRDDKGKGVIVKKSDHLCDCLRYFCVSARPLMRLKPVEQRPYVQRRTVDTSGRDWMV